MGEKRERKRVAGRFVRENQDGDAGVRPSAPRAPRPSKVQNYTRARVAEALPEIVGRFVQEAKKGSIPHTKLLTSLGGLDGEQTPQQTRRKDASAVLKGIAENMARLEND